MEPSVGKEGGREGYKLAVDRDSFHFHSSLSSCALELKELGI